MYITQMSCHAFITYKSNEFSEVVWKAYNCLELIYGVYYFIYMENDLIVLLPL